MRTVNAGGMRTWKTHGLKTISASGPVSCHIQKEGKMSF